jgi:hypothetical protein
MSLTLTRRWGSTTHGYHFMAYYTDEADAFLAQTYAQHGNPKRDFEKRAVLEFLLGNMARSLERDSQPLTTIELEFLARNGFDNIPTTPL